MRNSLLLRQVLQQDRNLAEVWAPFAREALEAEGLLAGVEAEIASWSPTAAS